MKNSNKYLKVFIYVLVMFLCLGYLGYKSTYASYETNITGKINPQIADWKILVNNVDLASNNETLELNSSSFMWTCTAGGVRENKIGPGCSGTMYLTIDASSTEVAVLYEFDIVDKNIDPNKILKVTNIDFDQPNFYRTGLSKYSGYLSLDSIKYNPELSLIIDVVWEDTGDIVYDEEFYTDDDNYITIDFLAKQYLGEEIIPYNE